MSVNRTVTLVGESNPYGENPAFALWDEPAYASGQRLRLHMGLRSETYRALDRTNLCRGAWSTPDARATAADLLRRCPRGPDGRVFVLLGVKVAEAFGFFKATVFWATTDESLARDPSTRDSSTVYVFLPHPSGRNPAWNNPTARTRARRVLAEQLPGIAWGEAD